LRCPFLKIPVPILATLRDDQIESIVKNCSPSLIICSADKLELAAKLKQMLPTMTDPIVLPSSVDDADAPLPSSLPSSICAMTFAEVENLGHEDSGIQPIRPNQPDDLATIIYTSGSTGSLPKGASIHDRMWLALINPILGNFDPVVTFCKGSPEF
jgi:long-subunit acyl-CoA synthetase (AMP-forming)